MREETIAGANGQNLFVRSLTPPGKVRGVVVIVHGFNAHSGQYVWVAGQLAEDGLAVYALDLRGRGRSDGERYFVERFSDYVNDVASLMALVKSRVSGQPIFLLGHSAGGVVACLYCLERQRDLAGLICESFAFQVPAPDIALALLKGVSHLAPHAHVLQLKNEDFSRDPKVVQAMNEDPLIANESQSSNTVAEMARADERLGKEFPHITLPLLILHGTADRATKPSGSRAFFARAGSADKTLKLYEGHFHDLLNDIGKETVMSDIKAWIGSRIAQ